jgi:hypothetical protein
MTFDHIEDWIALLEMQLKITGVQAEPWKGFADALRASAQRMSDIRLAMMRSPKTAETFSERLEASESILSVGLENTRAIRASFAALSSVLSDKQKKAADEMLAAPAGIGLGTILFERGDQTVQ